MDYPISSLSYNITYVTWSYLRSYSNTWSYLLMASLIPTWQYTRISSCRWVNGSRCLIWKVMRSMQMTSSSISISYTHPWSVIPWAIVRKAEMAAPCTKALLHKWREITGKLDLQTQMLTENNILYLFLPTLIYYIASKSKILETWNKVSKFLEEKKTSNVLHVCYSSKPSFTAYQNKCQIIGSCLMELVMIQKIENATIVAKSAPGEK